MEYISPAFFLREDPECTTVDVRSPAEYTLGHISGAINIPLFSDKERAEVGTLYTRSGRLEAIKKGLEIVGPRMVEIIGKTLKEAMHTNIKVYCWRGGMRSRQMAWLFDLIGYNSYVLEGGYKAYRNYLMKSLSSIPKLIVLHGPTGAGKTDIMKVIKENGEQVIDLEAIACHRGSAFGAIGMDEQPSTQQFQNDLFRDFLTLDPQKRIWVEGESLSIGKVYLPETLWESMNNAFIVKLEMKKTLRAERLVQDYGMFDKELIAEGIKKIRKKFGGDRVNECLKMLEVNDLYGVALHLLDYYDKTYGFSLKKYK